MTQNGSFERAATVVAEMARELCEGDVVATGVASPLAILAIEVAKRTHAPDLTWLACVGAIDPEVPTLRSCSEDLEYLSGRSGQVSIPDLFDHARSCVMPGGLTSFSRDGRSLAAWCSRPITSSPR